MRHGIREREVVPDIDVGGVAEQPWPDLSYPPYAGQDERNNHDVIDREDPQKSPDVELPDEEEAACWIRVPEFTAADQDARDEKTAEDEEEPDAQLSPVHLTHDQRMRRRLPIMDKDDAHHSEESECVELRHVAVLASYRTHERPIEFSSIMSSVPGPATRSRSSFHRAS